MDYHNYGFPPINFCKEIKSKNPLKKERQHGSPISSHLNIRDIIKYKDTTMNKKNNIFFANDDNSLNIIDEKIENSF
jgi:hypothetical protein